MTLRFSNFSQLFNQELLSESHFKGVEKKIGDWNFWKDRKMGNFQRWAGTIDDVQDFFYLRFIHEVYLRFNRS